MKYSFLFAFIAIFSQFNAQDSYINTTSSIPPSPTAASLGKYGDVPVSLYTGVPEINIPLYSVSEGNLSVPVSLSYHSSGFKVEEMAANTGLGWSLNSGGVITRAVKGVPDDFNGDLWGTAAAPNWNNCPNQTSTGNCRFPSYGYLSIANDLDAAYPYPYVGPNNLEEMTTNTKDGEPDIFYFNFAGHSGQFVFNKDGVPKFFSKQNLEITYTRNANGDIYKFQAIDGNGVIYYFETYESSSMSSSNGLSTNEYNPTTETNNCDFSYPTFLDPFISSWHLTKIKSPNSTHEITFSYISETQQYKTGFSRQYSYGGETNHYSLSCSFVSITSKKISEVIWNNGKITYTYNHQRQDIGCNLPGGYSYIPNYALTGISIFNQTNSLLKKYTLDYNYFGTAPFSDPNQNNGSNFDCNGRKLKLLSVKEYNSLENEFKPPYVFDYNTTVSLKPTYTSIKDFFGFQKTITPSTYGSLAPKVYYYPNETKDQFSKSLFSIYPRPSYTGSQLIRGNYDISPEADCQTAFLLTKITYPTGGSTSFEFEPHQFAFYASNRVGGGARIKKVTDYDGINTGINIIKTYSYLDEADPSKSSGVIMSLPNLAKTNVICLPNNGYTIFSNSISGLGTTFGSLVGYSRVEVGFNGNGKTVSFFNTQGAIGVTSEECSGGSCIYNSTESFFDNSSWSCDVDNFPFAENSNFDWCRGVLNEERIYNNASQLVKKSVNEYTIKSYEKIKAIKTGVYNAHSPAYPQITKYAPYYFLSGWKVLSKQITTEYDVLNSGREMVTAANYFYDNTDHLQLTKTTTTDSKGQTFETIVKRSKDYPGANGDMIFNLNAQHRLNEVIENQTWLVETPKKLLGASFNEYFDYKDLNGLATTQNLLYKQYQLEAAQPISSTSFQEATFDEYPILDSKYKPVVEYNYDNKDNLTRQSIYNSNKRNNNAVIYGHNKSIAIAQVNNAKETDCGFTSFESDDQNLWSIGGTVSLITNDGHCGTSSRSIPPSTYGPTRIYTPSADAQNKKYILSCWVKTNSSAGGSVGSLVMFTMQNPGNPAVYPSGAYFSTPINNTNSVWKYVEVEIDLKQIKIAGGLPLNTNLSLTSFVWNTGTTVNIQVDDIRLYPKDARMSTFTHLPLVGPSSISDENSNCQFYEYDTFGRLKIVKDQNGKILEKTDYNYKP